MTVGSVAVPAGAAARAAVSVAKTVVPFASARGSTVMSTTMAAACTVTSTASLGAEETPVRESAVIA
jgi:hypothetical protein